MDFKGLVQIKPFLSLLREEGDGTELNLKML